MRRLFSLFAIVPFCLAQRPNSELQSALGKALARQMEQRYPLLDAPDVTMHLERVAARMDTGYPWQLRVLKSGEVQSVVYPGGYFYISAGLLVRLSNESELAALLAHQIAHLRMQDQQPPVTSPDFGKVILNFCPLSSDGLQPLGMIRESREIEKHVNAAALQILADANYDPESLPNLLAHFIQDSPQRAAGWSVDDIAELNAAAKALAPAGGYVRDTSQFNQMRQSLGNLIPAPRAPSLFNSRR